MAEVVAAPPRLEMRNIGKSFAATVALDDVSITASRGEVYALVGENGAGKSTLMKVLSGAVRPDFGTMSLDGNPYAPRNPLDARHAGVGMIYQELSLAPHLSVEDNIVLGMEPSRLGVLRRSDIRGLAVDALGQLGHADIRPGDRTGSLSAARQQIVEIARAVAIGCRVLVLDEPTSSLSGEDTGRIFSLIDRLKARGISVIYISHFIEEVKRISDRFTVLRDGKSVGGGRTSDVTNEQIVDLMVGRRVDQLYASLPRSAGEVVLELDDVAGIAGPESSSLTLRRGEIVGIAGLVGAGRTEMIRVIFGLDPIKRGRVRLGAYVGPASPARRWSQGMGMLSEDRKTEGLAVNMSVADNLTLPNPGRGWFVPPSHQQQASAKWVERLDIRCRAVSQRVGELSGGNQQKVALARLLHCDVDVLLLDEPTRGIDVGSKALIYRLINELAAGDPSAGRQPKGVLMVSSYLPELIGVCDRVAVMCRGRLGPARPVSELDERAIMMEATGSGKVV